MHPILARGRFLALYLGIGVLVGGLLGAMLVAQAALDWTEALLVALPLAAVYAFVCLSGWYVSRSMPLVATSAVRILATALTSAVISSAVWLLVAHFWIGALVARGWVDAAGAGAAGLDALIFSLGVLLYLLSLAISYLLAGFEQLRETERRQLRVQVLSREAELRSLKAQIDPHFLFNSLHSISALTGSDPAAARRMCLLLADFLRDSLALGGEERITLARELALVERFLAIERVRFGSRLQVDIDGRDAGSCLVPPLLLQPIVENAVTHGVAHMLEGGTIRVAASGHGRRLSILVENPCDADRPRGRGVGVGLANVRARLSALHGIDARLDATEQNGVWRVEVTMPLDEGH
jgi:sensor histidine kinase YesM